MNLRRSCLLFLTASLAALLAACGNSNSSNLPVSVAFTSGFTPPSSMTAGTTAGIAATITNGPQGALVNWSCTPASACGSFSPASTASTTPTTYTAPTSVPSGGSVTVTGTLSTDSTKSVSQLITISAAPVISVTLTTPPPSSLPVQGTASIAATVSNDSQNKGVTWSCTPASACGSFAPASTASGTATTYTAPTSVPAGNTVTVTATSVTDTTKSASAQITITSTAISVTLTTPPPSSMNVNQAVSVTASVANAANGGVTWSCTPASACGSFNPTSTASGAATSYTAPASVPTGNTVTVAATSVTDPTKSASAQVTINPAGSITVTLTALPPSSLAIQGTASVVATVANDGSNSGVNWSCTPSAACGSFSPTSTASAASTTYTAPNIVPQSTSGNVTIAATSVANSGASASAVVTITSNISVAFSSGFAPPSSLNINQAGAIAATVTGDPNGSGVNWTVTCGSADCGGFSPTTTNSTVPTTYTAPASIPTGNTVTITATSISDYTKTASGTVTIAQPTALLPDGTYVFQVAGQDTNGAIGGSPFNVAGAFTVNTNAITGGEQDFSDTLFSGSDSIQPTGVSSGTTMTATADGNLQIILDTADTSNIGNGSGLETLNITLTSPTSGLISWFDGFATGTGTLTLQDPTAAGTTPLGGYALLSSGYEITNSNVFNLAIGGIPIVASDGSISGFFDVNDSGTAVTTKIPFAATSKVTTPDSFGRVQFTLDSSSLNEIVLAGYIANASAIPLVEISDSYLGYTGGIALAQGSNAGTFGLASLSGFTYAFAAQGADNQPFADFAGALTFSGTTSLSVSGNATLNDIGFQNSGPVSGTCSIDSTGRATIFGLTLGNQSGHIQLYLDGNGNGLVASMNASDVLAGPAFQQTASAVSGSYAMNGIGISGLTLNAWSSVGPITIASGTISAGFADFNYYGADFSTVASCNSSGNTCPDVPLSGTISTTAGTITGLGADTLLAGTQPPASDTFDVYPIDSSHAFAIENEATQLGLLYLAPFSSTPSLSVRQTPKSTTTKAGRQKTAVVRTRTFNSQTAK